VLGAVLLCLPLTSCPEKLKEFLPKPAPKEDVGEKLTPEQEKLQKAAETADLFGPEKPPTPEDDAPKAPPFEVNKSSLVSIMCYHDFADKAGRSDMVIAHDTFRSQMQALKDANIPVIPMSDVLAWKRGEKNIPDEAVVISMDDGWVGVYNYAYPILKEFGYPFTFFLYKNYVNRGGRSMTIAQIKEMLAYGAEVGSHSVSHQDLRAKHGKTEEAYQAWLKEEIAGSKKYIDELLGVSCKVFAYPYGNKSPEIAQMCIDAGYEAAVTVNPQKVTWDRENGLLPRFVQIGDKDINFKLATSFHGSGNSIANSKFIKTDAVDDQGKKLVELSPKPNETITIRRPVISANLLGLGAIVPESLVMRVSGFGAVPVEFDPSTQTVSYHVPQRLRLDECTVNLNFRRADAEKDEIVSWKFKIDQAASYLPQDVVSEPAPESAPPVIKATPVPSPPAVSPPAAPAKAST
jgi:peptidoglycan/xylan/chitin deacetylase (PgdA/CDA1 family)